MKKFIDKYNIPSVHREGIIIIMIAFFVSMICFSFCSVLGYVSLILTAFVIYFFRDPKRITPEGKGMIVSPADGIVQSISECAPPEELDMSEESMIRISVFLNVFNVHVNRVPATGRITKAVYIAGKFLNASLDKSSIHNERQLVRMETEDGVEIAFSQIAGLIARRIICNLKDDDNVKCGERFGIIRFGSRMDVFVPKGTDVKVLQGQTMIGGETVLAVLS